MFPKITNFFSQFIFRTDKPLCSIGEIDLANNRIVIYCKGIQTPIKLRLDEIIEDTIILSNLSSNQACWVGYYYGKFYKNQINLGNISVISLNLSNNLTSKKFHITMINRIGNIVYADIEDNSIYTKDPYLIISNRKLIENFDSLDACYIGFLGSLSEYKFKK